MTDKKKDKEKTKKQVTGGGASSPGAEPVDPETMKVQEAERMAQLLLEVSTEAPSARALLPVL